MSETEKKKKGRKVLRANFTKAANELDGLLKAEQLDVSAIEISWECLQPKFNALRGSDEELYECLLESATEEELIIDLERCDVYVKKFTELRLKTEKTLYSKPLDEEMANKVVMEPFGCDGLTALRWQVIRDWLPFWAQFRKIHEDQYIDDSDKLEYLVQATIPGSRARQLVESFPAMSENYQKIIEGLQARFGREDMQIEVYVRELLKLVLSNAGSNQKFDISNLYDRIETQLRALETFNITSDKYSAILFPLIESCLPHELMRIWQRSPFNSSASSESTSSSNLSLNGDSTLEVRLKHLMEFLRAEVENEQRINLASEGFGLSDSRTVMKEKVSSGQSREKLLRHDRNYTSTAAGLVNTSEVAKCIFCSGMHSSEACFKAQKLTLDEKKQIITEKRVCFRCLKAGHQSRKCHTRLKCIICSQSHLPLMCPSLPKAKKGSDKSDASVENINKDQVLTNQSSTHVFLQTIRVTLKGSVGVRVVRALIDTGSQRSYILKSTVNDLGLQPKRVEKIMHCLFGGTGTTNNHYCYDVTVTSDKYAHTFEVLDQPYICNEVSPIFYGPWLDEIKGLKIDVSDINKPGPIELLLGADVAEMLHTGRSHNLKCGLVAIETRIGWTVMGKVPRSPQKTNETMTVLSLFVKPSITELWQLDVLGIQDPIDRKSKEEMALAAKEQFLQTVNINSEGRYEVRLPWLEGHPPLPTNYTIAKKRLDSTIQKLGKNGLFDRYDQVFKEWEDMNIIEQVHEDKVSGHFLPHRPVVKEGSTTAVRPVYDASAREKDKPSLNQCLEKGLNLIEQIPALLIRFRENKIGIISDIKKAFLQISVHEKDRNFMKFLWIDGKGQEVIFKHNRVVFGVNCSPFLLGATLEYHLARCLKNSLLENAVYSKETIERLSKSFYVDNCVTSISKPEEMNKFIREAVQVMAEGQFDLRGWEFSGNPHCDEVSVSVLGLTWYPKQDVLTINKDLLENIPEDNEVTKRKLLSMAQKIFDPIGFTAPTTLIPKLLLQRLWENQITWDTPVDEEISIPFKKWLAELPYLLKIEIPRWMYVGNISEMQDLSIHTFCDASQNAFAAVVFLRIEENNMVKVHLLAAKSRVAPLKKLTIPRLELLAATIGARLYNQVIENLDQKISVCYFWSDSSTVISWVQRNEEWGTFVFNRAQEIRKLTPAEQWRHIPGSLNIADIPSRGCSPKQLYESRWWEGPTWLYQNKQNWPCKKLIADEEEVAKERKKKLIATLTNVNEDVWHLCYFGKFSKTVRMIAWCCRFVQNIRRPNIKCRDELRVEELNNAETFIFKQIQRQSFCGIEDKQIRCLDPFYGKDGLIRLKSRVCNRNDTDGYRFPVVLPARHPVVNSLIMDMHRRLCHVGTQGLLGQLREHYWILGGRRTIRSVTSKCVTCRRLVSKPLFVESPPLPLDRVRDAVAFEVSGVDFAGPLFLKNGGKAWVCLFTCAVYRAVHLELASSLSTDSFLQAFRRFVARRGRPKTLYSDNGTNFRGAENAFANLDWDKILLETSTQRITWRFNPPTASWWGGFFERLIGVVKQLLRRLLGRACLTYEELLTMICDCESVINSRPLTYVSNDPKDLIPLTPTMFLRDQAEVGVPDCDEVDRASLSRSARHRQKLRDDLRKRFRSEYLGQLKFLQKGKTREPVKLGDVVLVGNDNTKRVEWPIGRIIDVLPGKDGLVRLVRVKTARGDMLRPVQRLFPLEFSDCAFQAPNTELSHSMEEAKEEAPVQSKKDIAPRELTHDEEGAGVFKSRVLDKVKITSKGRVSKLPKRYL